MTNEQPKNATEVERERMFRVEAVEHEWADCTCEGGTKRLNIDGECKACGGRPVGTPKIRYD